MYAGNSVHFTLNNVKFLRDLTNYLFSLFKASPTKLLKEKEARKKKTQSNLTEKKRFFEHDTRI